MPDFEKFLTGGESAAEGVQEVSRETPNEVTQESIESEVSVSRETGMEDELTPEDMERVREIAGDVSALVEHTGSEDLKIRNAARVATVASMFAAVSEDEGPYLDGAPMWKRALATAVNVRMNEIRDEGEGRARSPEQESNYQLRSAELMERRVKLDEAYNRKPVHQPYETARYEAQLEQIKAQEEQLKAQHHNVTI